jgi:hypothetical protein
VRDVEYRSLSSSPLNMGVRDWRVSRSYLGKIPPEEIRVVGHSSGMEVVVVHEDRVLIASETSADSLDDEVVDVEVADPTSDVEVLDWQLSNGQ